ncbi:MAG: hydantoinase/oxoprolinase family protein, partial [Deltaproteobacteria bacterium]|nr:hydantoinase/oxoprolinase family protein [Deltaproteobacteria bacterium]
MTSQDTSDHTPCHHRSWEFWIDRGGTFTDCIGRSPTGELHVAKLLSSDTAPVEGIRHILERSEGLAAGDSLPASRVRLGTTVATNALLERRGEPLLLVTNAGFGDSFEIGTQERSEIFALKIEKPPPLQAQVLEIKGRMNAQGEEIEALDLQQIEQGLHAAKAKGLDSVAIVLLHAFANPTHEEAVAELARDVGFSHVSTSQALAGEIGFLARGETVIADAYLTPLLQRHVRWLRKELPGSQLRFMQSSGGLTEAKRFRGPYALLSGPAGGVVGASRVAKQAGFERAICFDMGGTSTDVSLVEKDGVARRFESIVGGVRVKAPMLAIHTVAAGGGSLCQFDGYRFTVGPESAGSDPGPLCYGKKDSAGQFMGKQLALTDINYFLGRIQPDYFPFALTREPVDSALSNLQSQLAKAGQALTLDDIAAGFIEVANKSMAQAIAQVSVARGIDPREYALVGFGGAAGQHVAAVARELGIRDVLLHPLAGLLSAYGIGVAEESWDGVSDAGREILEEAMSVQISSLHEKLRVQGARALQAEGFAVEEIALESFLDLRYRGTESSLTIAAPGDGNYRSAFEAEHQTRFGYTRPGRPVEVVAARVRARVPAAQLREEGSAALSATQPGEPLRLESMWFPGAGRVQAPVFDREQLQEGQVLQGPALVLD